mgnify:FL=1
MAAVLTQEDLYKKMISNMVEVRTRGAFVLAITNEGNTEVERAADYVLYIPKTNKYLQIHLRSFRCSYLDIMCQSEEGAMWISREISRNR